MMVSNDGNGLYAVWQGSGMEGMPDALCWLQTGLKNEQEQQGV